MIHSYKKCRNDAEYLELLNPVNDTADLNVEVMNFMRNPTEKKGALMYMILIELWVYENREGPHMNNAKVKKIIRDHA